MEDQGDYKPTTNAYYYPPKSNNSQLYTDISSISDATGSSDVTSILASALNIMGNNPEAKDTVVESLMSLNQSWKLYHMSILLFLVYCAYGLPSYPP